MTEIFRWNVIPLEEPHHWMHEEEGHTKPLHLQKVPISCERFDFKKLLLDCVDNC